jgi:hypothetical protein
MLSELQTPNSELPFGVVSSEMLWTWQFFNIYEKALKFSILRTPDSELRTTFWSEQFIDALEDIIFQYL